MPRSLFRLALAHAAFWQLRRLVRQVGRELGLENLISGLSAEALAETMTFEEVERRIIQDLKGRIISGAGADMDSLRSIDCPSAGWPLGEQTAGAFQRHNARPGRLLRCAGGRRGLLRAEGEIPGRLQLRQCRSGPCGYQTELFRFDQLYRQFNHAADAVEPMGWALLHELRERIENGYSGWFVPQLGSAWSKVLEGEGVCFLAGRSPAGKISRTSSHGTSRSHLDSGIKRVFVVISDAFRYEAAEELVRDINGKSRFKAVLTPMLGVLPSYTALGMAALLPHDTLAYKQNATSM
jgi:hypothetical protein